MAKAERALRCNVLLSWSRLWYFMSLFTQYMVLLYLPIYRYVCTVLGNSVFHSRCAFVLLSKSISAVFRLWYDPNTLFFCFSPVRSSNSGIRSKTTTPSFARGIAWLCNFVFSIYREAKRKQSKHATDAACWLLCRLHRGHIWCDCEEILSAEFHLCS